MSSPQQIATVHAEHVGDDLCLYNWDRKEVHTLNQTAAFVWQYCDGQTTIAEIASRLEAQFGIADAESLVQLTLNQLEAAHLLAATAVDGPKRTGIGRRSVLAVGIAAALLPVIDSITAPTPIAAQSPLPTPTLSPTPPPTPTIPL